MKLKIFSFVFFPPRGKSRNFIQGIFARKVMTYISLVYGDVKTLGRLQSEYRIVDLQTYFIIVPVLKCVFMNRKLLTYKL
jgi:hypothetical protein